MFPKNILYYGKEDPLPERVHLRAGPLVLVYEGGDLRNIRVGGNEVLRRIYVAIRDRDWGTVPPVLSNVCIEQQADSFHLTFDVTNQRNEIEFFWHGQITGEPVGRLTFSMEGEARTTFLKNRIGFCVLHPASLAGANCMIEHVDGIKEKASLPVLISPDQPVGAFGEMRALTHEVEPGLQVEVRMEGDVFEMEDQRNWTDASFKTFSTPIRLPYPVEIQAGTKIHQTISVTLQDVHEQVREEAEKVSAFQAKSPALRAPVRIALDFQKTRLPLPSLGLCFASPLGTAQAQPLTEQEVARLKALHINHLRVDVRLADPNYPQMLRHATAQAQELGLALDIALIFDPEQPAGLVPFRSLIEQLDPPVRNWLVYPAQELFLGGSPTRAVVSMARAVLDGVVPGARFAAGTNADFIFFQRTPPPLELVEAVCLAMNPQVHADDNLTLVENLEGQMHVVRTARERAGGRPVLVSPVTLRQRFNPVASGPVLAPAPGQLPPQVDPRQVSLFGAGWTLGSLKYLAESGAESITYYETVGWRGVMERSSGSPLPRAFPSLAGTVFPLYHVLADVGEFAHGEVAPLSTSDPLQVDGIALHKNGRSAILLANLTGEPQRVLLPDLAGLMSMMVRQMNENNVAFAVQSPEEYRQVAGELLQPGEDCLTLDLPSYGLARINITPGE